jgi:hypothetical protein
MSFWTLVGEPIEEEEYEDDDPNDNENDNLASEAMILRFFDKTVNALLCIALRQRN